MNTQEGNSHRPIALRRLVLVRHGETEWTKSGRHTGLTDIGLNGHGEDCAREVGVQLESLSFKRVFTSPLSRAMRTCELTGLSGRAEVLADLVEWDYGDYEGLTSAEIKKDRPGWQLFRDGAPGGESPDEIARRADRFLQFVRSIDGDVIAFSSGHIIRMIAARSVGLPPEWARIFFTSTASIGILGFEHSRDEPVVLSWNRRNEVE